MTSRRQFPFQSSAVSGGLWALAVLLLPLPTPTAQAGPPFFTDDPEPVEVNHWEFYLAWQYSHSRGGDRSTTAPHFEVNYGAWENLQLHAIAPFELECPSDERSRYGYGDTELGFKYRFLKESEWFPSAGVFPLVTLPTGDESRGLGAGRAQWRLPVWLQKSFGEWTTYGGGGYGLGDVPDSKDYWFFGWELQRRINEHLTLGGELYYSTPDEVGGARHFGFNLGAVVDITENHHILFSAGRDFVGDTTFQMYLAYQLTF